MDTIIEHNSAIRLKNPFPGLRPFNEHESHLYFGRDKQVGEVLDKLEKNHFVAIIGTSGIGKSSFIYCGLFPKLRQNDLSFNLREWEIYRLRPGISPLQQLKQSLELKPEANHSESFYTQTDSGFPMHALSKDFLVQFFTQKNEINPTHKNYLIFVDQFEELFNPQNHPEEAKTFVDILQYAASQRELPIYVVITMRSDFIGNCSQYPEFTESINESQFLIPYMTRQEKEEAIVKPIQKNGAQVESDLVELILDDVGNTLDQLPLMQHALMRTWDVWEKSSDEIIRKHHYQQIGRIKNALSKHADEAFNELKPEQKNICAKVFKAITFNKIRRPTPLGEIAAIANASVKEVKDIVEHFRREDCGLLMPPPDVLLNEQSIIDISHESLISNWTTLSSWVEEESESIKSYLRLSEAAEMHQEGKVSLWRPPQLTLALNWWKDQEPTVAWAERYHTAFEYERAKQFLEASQRAYEKDLENDEKLKKRKVRQANVIAVIFFLGAVVAGIFGIYAYYESIAAEKSARIALENAQKAEAQRKFAEMQKKRAESERTRAENERKAADEARDVAERKTQEALEAEKRAKLEELRAVNEAIRAEKARKDAVDQRRLAELEKQKAEIERQLAEIAERKAERLRYLDLAKTMAIKSAQMEDSIVQKALLAKQAFEFNWEYGGDFNDPDIYNGLYYAVKELFRQENKQYSQLEGHAAKIRAFAPYQSDKVFSAGDDGRILLLSSDWQSTGKPVLDSIRQDGLIHRAVALSPAGQTLACAGYYPSIQLLNPKNLSDKILNIPATNSQIWYLAFLSERQVVSADKNGQIAVWDTESRTPVKSLKKDPEQIHDIAVYRNMLYVALGNQILRISPETMSEEALFKDSSPIYALTIAKDGKMACGNLRGNISVFDLNGGNFIKLGDLRGHKGLVNSMTFNQNSDQLASGSSDGTVRVWDVSMNKSGYLRGIDEPPIILKDHILENQKQQTHYVWAIAFSPNGKKLLAGCSNSLVRSWPTQIIEMANLICPKLTRNFSKKEWERFVAPTDEIFYRRSCDSYPDGNGVEEKDKQVPEKNKKLSQPSNLQD